MAAADHSPDYPLLSFLALPVLVCSVPDGTIVLCNRVAAALFGYPAAELIGSSAALLDEYATAPEQERFSHWCASLPVSSAPPDALTLTPPVDVRARRKSGEPVMLELSASVLPADLGLGGPHALVVARDIGETRQEEEARLRRERLEGVRLAARTFQHELNTKLAATIAYAQLILRDGQLPPHLRRYADRAAVGAREAARVIAQLVELSHPDDVSLHDWGAHGLTINVDVPHTDDRAA